MKQLDTVDEDLRDILISYASHAGVIDPSETDKTTQSILNIINEARIDELEKLAKRYAKKPSHSKDTGNIKARIKQLSSNTREGE